MNETIQKLVDELSEQLVQDLWKLILTALRRQPARMEIPQAGVSGPAADPKRLAVANNGLPLQSRAAAAAVRVEPSQQVLFPDLISSYKEGRDERQTSKYVV